MVVLLVLGVVLALQFQCCIAFYHPIRGNAVLKCDSLVRVFAGFGKKASPSEVAGGMLPSRYIYGNLFDSIYLIIIDYCDDDGRCSM